MKQTGDRERYIVGRRYEVPHVRAAWPAFAPPFEPRWIPVLGPAHRDAEVINFEWKHFHVDLRFLPDRVRRDTSSVQSRCVGSVAGVFALPITSVWPSGYRSKERPRNSVMLDRLPLGLPLESWFTVRRSTCRVVAYPPYPATLWARELEKMYAGARLKPGQICPHRGADLSTFEPDEAGCVTCPLHGLRWHVESGRLVTGVKN